MLSTSMTTTNRIKKSDNNYKNYENDYENEHNYENEHDSCHKNDVDDYYYFTPI